MEHAHKITKTLDNVPLKKTKLYVNDIVFRLYRQHTENGLVIVRFRFFCETLSTVFLVINGNY